LGVYWWIVGDILVHCLWYTGELLVIYWWIVGDILVNCWWYTGELLVMLNCWWYTSYLLVINWWIVDDIMVIYWWIVGDILVNCWWYTGELLVIYWWIVGNILVNCLCLLVNYYCFGLNFILITITENTERTLIKKNISNIFNKFTNKTKNKIELFYMLPYSCCICEKLKACQGWGMLFHSRQSSDGEISVRLE